MKRVALGMILGAATLLAVPARADENHIAAEALFDEGLRLFDQGKILEACPKFAASQKLDPASGTLLNLGRCWEKLGKTASAWSAYRDLASQARKENNPKREAQGKQLADKLQPKLAKLTVDAPDGVIVKLDQVDLDAAELKTPLPIDPGDHALEATAASKKPWKKDFKVGEGEQPTIAVPILEDVPIAPPPPPAANKPETDAGLGPLRIAALASGGAGVVGLALGGVFGAIALSHASDARDHCVGRCDSDGLSARDDARSSADVSTVALVAGGVFLAGGVVLWLVAPQRRASTGFRTPGISLKF